MEITLRHLEILQAIVVSGSISKAKRALGLSQPTISQQLAKFEELLGAQLIYRQRGNDGQLTQAGEHWFKVAQSVLGTLDQATVNHKARLGKDGVELHFGTTPSMRGRFMEKAATLSRDIPGFSRMEFVWALGSAELVEMIATHRINCAILSEASVVEYKMSIHMVHLFNDKIVLAVPADVDDAALVRTLNRLEHDDDETSPLRNYVEVGKEVPWKSRSEHWYRQRMPRAAPYFSCMTHQGAVDIVAAGLATCHAPLSLLPNLPNSVRDRIKVYDLGEYVRDAVLVMPKHLLTLRPFAEFQQRLSDWVIDEYSEAHLEQELLSLPELRIAAE
ncbi:LysR family transcriptional regulator [Maritimibacter sp. UBA3975]|uniref:LysR family transcriptional regulator n=1 Tax=Maritimibacter sp. UBA3975 TaxID=1946833 RepID=UPI0025B7B899|nr:LysR family transcriptional regulator [Maritimibacter sp. UBA3975]